TVFSGSRYDGGTRYCNEATSTRTFNNLLRPALQTARPMPTSKPNSCNPRSPWSPVSGMDDRRAASKSGNRRLDYNQLVSLTAARQSGEVFQLPSAAKALSALLISGLLFGFPGAILPAWGYHLSSDFSTVGNYFLCMSLGVIISTEAAGRMLVKRGIGFLLVSACALACAALLYLAILPTAIEPLWRLGGLLAIGFSTGLLNTGVFHAISPVYDRDPAATANIGGISFGMGSLGVT